MLDRYFKGLHLAGSRAVPDDSASEGLRLLLHGRDDFPLELVRTSRRHSEIHEVAGQSGCPGRDHRCVAVLAIDRERSGRAGRGDVGVFVDGGLVGYLPGYLSTQYREWLHAWNLSRAVVHCRALIQCDCASSASGPAGYRVKLDVEMPFRMTTIQL
ncbi:hypothetical protein [Novosphingobium mangrovi (ex Huang et al. 2023)]|uniref:HIRAN domain-containing protein n=1 Tax=Novosphingobium mangrovi (ex Huang et al. 2023) TaxID=2976432 RepID=A0ABT2IA08_9SPHN|nr:hypothetical protein [Novosphingobium mangrovi (ex Huang et al. 2023)]MCT2401654.1 hypothetical protein [Novosphingobium mangrovi (ex Huang et al. 2023)]